MNGPYQLSRKLVLEALERQPDNAGGFVEYWRAQGTVWADMRAGSGRARSGATSALASVPYRIVVRAAPVGAPSRPRAGQRFRAGARLFVIQAVADSDGEGRYLHCFTHEEVLP